MFQFSSRTALAVVLCAASSIASAQIEEGSEPAPPAPADAAPPAAVAPAPMAAIRLPALTLVELTVLDEISSKTAISGETIRMALAHPLYVTPDSGLPAGTPVDGVVIHAAKGGMGGKSGELLLGAKRIVLAGSEIPLRSFKLAPARGKNNETLALVTTAAIGVAGLLISGGSARAPAGTTASAKTSAEVSIPVALLSKLPPQPTTPPPGPPAPPVNAQPTTTAQGEMK